MKITLNSPAKINLSLKIGAIQKNGLHEIDSIFHKIDLYDEIIIEKLDNKKGQKIQMEILGKEAKGVPSNSENTAHKAAKAFFCETGIKESIKITIQKNIPFCAGLGGASSNAGTVLLGLEKLFKTKLKDKVKTASEIGSDVPFFASDFSCARVRGTGEIIEKMPKQDFNCLVVVLPYIKIGTAWAYQKLDEFKADNFRTVMYQFFPDLKKVEEKMLALEAEKASLSGSGSAVFGIFDKEKLHTACKKLYPQATKHKSI